MKNRLITAVLIFAVAFLASGCGQTATAVGTLEGSKMSEEGPDMSNPFDVMEYMRAHAEQMAKENEDSDTPSKAFCDGVILSSMVGYDADSQKKALLIVDSDCELAKKSEIEFVIKDDEKELFSNKAKLTETENYCYSVLDFTKYKDACKGTITITDDPTIKNPVFIKRKLYGELYEEKIDNLIHSDTEYSKREMSEKINIVLELELISEYADSDLYRDEIQGMLESFLDELTKEANGKGSLTDTEKSAVATLLFNGAACLKNADTAKYIESAQKLSEDVGDKDDIWKYCSKAASYRATGDKKSREEFEKLTEAEIYNGLSYDSPGDFGNLAYVSCSDVNKSVAGELVYGILEDANEHVANDIFAGILEKDTLEYPEYRRLPIVNEITASSQYTKYMQNAITIMCGCNPKGINALSDSDYEWLFVLAYLSK